MSLLDIYASVFIFQILKRKKEIKESIKREDFFFFSLSPSGLQYSQFPSFPSPSMSDFSANILYTPSRTI